MKRVLLLLFLASARLLASDLIDAKSYSDFLQKNTQLEGYHYYDEKMMTGSQSACIHRSRTPGDYRYQAGTQATDYRLKAAGAEKSGSSLPITFLSYNDAVQYCAWKNQNDSQSFSPQPSVFSLASQSDAIDEDLKSNQFYFLISSEPQSTRATSIGRAGTFEKDTFAGLIFFASLLGGELANRSGTRWETPATANGASLRAENGDKNNPSNPLTSLGGEKREEASEESSKPFTLGEAHDISVRTDGAIDAMRLFLKEHSDFFHQHPDFLKSPTALSKMEAILLAKKSLVEAHEIQEHYERTSQNRTALLTALSRETGVLLCRSAAAATTTFALTSCGVLMGTAGAGFLVSTFCLLHHIQLYSALPVVFVSVSLGGAAGGVGSFQTAMHVIKEYHIPQAVKRVAATAKHVIALWQRPALHLSPSYRSARTSLDAALTRAELLQQNAATEDPFHLLIAAELKILKKERAGLTP